MKRRMAALFLLNFLMHPIWAFAAQPQSGTPSEVRALEPGKTLEGEMAAGEVHAYRIDLEAGQFLRAVVNQRGIDLVVSVIGPDGQKIAEVDSPTGANGPEPVTLAAKVSGTYRLEVRALQKDAKPGRYDIKIEELLTAAEYRARLASEKATSDAVKSWLAANAIRLSTVEAGHGFAEMQPLKKIVGEARVVSLGEATHGTREFFQLKHRMLEFLVNEMGFNIFAIEATMPESFDINEYVLTGRGDLAKALAGIYFWTWDTEEVLEMIEWMRRYNADAQHTRKVKFYGFDIQSAARAAKVTLAYLRRVDPAQAEMAEKELALQANPYTEFEFAKLAQEKKAAAGETIKSVVASLESRKQDYVKRSSADDWAIARQHAQVLAQNIEMQSGPSVGFTQQAVRDRSMAENIRWILDHEGPGAKMVAWAHNGHVATQNQYGMDWMGQHLRRALGREMVVFGFAFNQGGFQAMEMPFPSERGLRPFNVTPASEGSLDSMLASAGLQMAAIDLRALPTDGPVAKWFGEPKATRSIGAGYGEQFAANFLTQQVTPKIYDALLFVEKTTPARPVDKIDSRGPAPKLSAPANADFEGGEVGKLPADWRASPKLRRYDFQIATSEERPYSGKRCVEISRAPGKHYGEVVGSVVQRLDATAYRGKKIKLRAAARAELAGAGNLSWLRLNVSRKGFGPQSAAFDSLDKYPITSPEWRVYEIIADVPKDADSISYALVLVGDGKAWLDSVSVEVVDK
ncbi:MAG TPA: erythromycin esterase family protein [Blastocatellia bacterium]|nr:erythromycin esterase family protein [Blastocatellia bacterium]